jgi:hypothetical protein
MVLLMPAVSEMVRIADSANPALFRSVRTAYVRFRKTVAAAPLSIAANIGLQRMPAALINHEAQRRRVPPPT